MKSVSQKLAIINAIESDAKELYSMLLEAKLEDSKVEKLFTELMWQDNRFSYQDVQQYVNTCRDVELPMLFSMYKLTKSESLVYFLTLEDSKPQSALTALKPTKLKARRLTDIEKELAKQIEDEATKAFIILGEEFDYYLYESACNHGITDVKGFMEYFKTYYW